MIYIHKKDDNLIIPKALVNGHWQPKEQAQQRIIASGDNVSYLPGALPSNHQQEDLPSDKWYGYGAVATLMIVLGGVFLSNMQNDQERELASILPAPEFIEYQPQRDQKIVNQLRSGERSLQSVGSKNLELKDRLEYEDLRSYHVSFNNYDQVIHVELKPESHPSYISNYQEFFQKYEPFFSSLDSVKKVNEEEDDVIKTLTFQANQSLLFIQEDQQGNLISLNVKEI